MADLRTGRPMRADLHYRAGSLTKALVATVVLQLVAEGRLSLRDTVERWLPGILPYGDQVTVEQLLRHTSGVPDSPPVFLVPAGHGHLLLNTGYILLGLIVEAATGNTLRQELDRRIPRPPGLRDTFFPVNALACPAPRHGATACRSAPRALLAGPLVDVTIHNPSLPGRPAR